MEVAGVKMWVEGAFESVSEYGGGGRSMMSEVGRWFSDEGPSQKEVFTNSYSGLDIREIYIMTTWNSKQYRYIVYFTSEVVVCYVAHQAASFRLSGRSCRVK